MGVVLEDCKYNNEKFLAKYDAYKGRAFHQLKEFLDYNQIPSSLKEVISYSLLGSGKLFRPVLVAAVSDAFGVSDQNIKNIQIAVELVHASSLMHDDLPALDNDDFRRGRPSTHKVFGEGLTLLGGDYLLSKASQVILQSSLSSEVKVKILNELNKAICDMCEGQVLDLDIRKDLPAENDLISKLKELNLKKTGALIRFSLISPLYLSNFNQTKLDLVEEYSKNISILFQLCDDLLDSKHDTKKGEYREINYLDVLGVEKTEKYAEDLVQNTIKAIDFLGEKGNFLKYLVKFVKNQK